MGFSNILHFLQGSFDMFIFYLVQDDYIYIYVYIYIHISWCTAPTTRFTSWCPEIVKASGSTTKTGLTLRVVVCTHFALAPGFALRLWMPTLVATTYENAVTGDKLVFQRSGSWCVGSDCSSAVGGANSDWRVDDHT